MNVALMEFHSALYVTRVWLGPGLGKWMNDHFTTHLLWAVSSGDLISNESIFCHESHHSYLMCNKEQSKEELRLFLFPVPLKHDM